MHRLTRWTLNALTAFSLILCAAMAWFWSVAPHRDYCLVSTDTTTSLLILRPGGLAIAEQSWAVFDVSGKRLPNGVRDTVAPGDEPDVSGYHAFRVGTSTVRPAQEPEFGRFAFSRECRSIGSHNGGPNLGCDDWEVRLPYPGAFFLLGGMFVALFCWAGVPGRSQGGVRRSGTKCCNCSYDLTGNVSGVCPECGVAIAKGNTRSASPDGCATPCPRCS